MSKYEGHTPGPWEQGVGEDSLEVYGGMGIPSNPRVRIATCNSRFLDKTPNEANAKLIADAPMLAERVEYLEAGEAILKNNLEAAEHDLEETKQNYLKSDEERAELAEQNEKMLTMLNIITTDYINLIASGDCGNFNPYEDKEIIKAKNLIAEIEGEK
jgi:hypothetical protein